MLVLRCTQKLLKRNPGPTTGRQDSLVPMLGSWHANLIRLAHSPIVLCVNDISLLAILLPGRRVPARGGGWDSVSNVRILLAAVIARPLKRRRYALPFTNPGASVWLSKFYSRNLPKRRMRSRTHSPAQVCVHSSGVHSQTVTPHPW